MNHNDIRHMLSEYLDDAVSPGDRTAIEEHLKTCENCTEALKQLKQAVAAIRTIEEIDPPAWMTQKIMAKVRVEAGEKSWFHRLFFPLQIKLPLEAIGVLFIAVTTVFIYQNMQPTMKTPSALPEERAPAKEQQPVMTANNDEPASPELPRRSKDLPQSPGYKALDMRLWFEQPAPPELQSETAAPASIPIEKKQAYTVAGERAQTFLKKEEADSGMSRDSAATSSDATPEASVKAESAAPAAPFAGALPADKTVSAVILQVTDMETAVKNVEKAIAQVHGSTVRRESSGAKLLFFVTIKAQRAGELKNKLKLIGEMKEQPGEWGAQKEQVALRIEVVLK